MGFKPMTSVILAQYHSPAELSSQLGDGLVVSSLIIYLEMVKIQVDNYMKYHIFELQRKI